MRRKPSAGRDFSRSLQSAAAPEQQKQHRGGPGCGIREAERPDGPGRLVRRQPQRKRQPPERPDEHGAGIHGPDEGRKRREGVFELENAGAFRLQRPAEHPRSDPEDQSENESRTDVERESARERGAQSRPQPFRNGLLRIGAGPRQNQEEQSRRDRGALFRQVAQEIKQQRPGIGPPPPRFPVDETQRAEQTSQNQGRCESLAPPDDAGDRLDVHGVHREEQGRPDGDRRRREAQQQRRQEQRRRGVPQEVDGVEGNRIPAVDPPLRGEREEKERTVGRAGARRAPEVLRGEEVDDALRRPQADVVPDDRLVVVGEGAGQPVGVGESARAEQQERPRKPEALANHRIE